MRQHGFAQNQTAVPKTFPSTWIGSISSPVWKTLSVPLLLSCSTFQLPHKFQLRSWPPHVGLLLIVTCLFYIWYFSLYQSEEPLVPSPPASPPTQELGQNSPCQCLLPDPNSATSSDLQNENSLHSHPACSAQSLPQIPDLIYPVSTT